MNDWNQEQALKAKRCKTRDGRTVLGLREGKLTDGGITRKVLLGDVIRAEPPYKKGKLYFSEAHFWPGGGLGHHGGDDLVNDS